MQCSTLLLRSRAAHSLAAVALRRSFAAAAAAAAAARVRVVLLAGPTAVGKTALAVRLARSLGGELVSADSVKVYAGLEIGANSPSGALRGAAVFHNVGVLPWRADHSAMHFVERVRAIILDVASRGRVPIVVGGTGLYLRWLLYGPASTPPPDPAARARAEAWVREDASWDASLRRLADRDPVYAASLHRNDVYRLVRALTVVYSGAGHDSVSGHAEPRASSALTRDALEFDARCFFMHDERVSMYRTIDARAMHMLRAGLLCEVAARMREGLDTTCSAGRAIGYRQSIEYLRACAAAPLEWPAFRGFVERVCSASRNLCARQLRWFREEPLFLWTRPDEQQWLAEMCALDEDAFRAAAECDDARSRQAARVAQSTVVGSREQQQALRRYALDWTPLLGGADAGRASDEAREALLGQLVLPALRVLSG